MAVIGDLRRLVHLGADTVADVFPDDGVAVTLHVLLDGCRDIEQPVALLGELDPLKKLCLVTSIRSCASGEILPQGKVAAQSP